MVFSSFSLCEDAIIHHILLLDDYAVVSAGYRRLIDSEADMRVMAAPGA